MSALTGRLGAAAGGGAAVIAVGVALAVRGDLTLDIGWGRTRRPLGPFGVDVSAPQEVVFAVIADPYLGRTPHAMADKLQVVERGSDMVLAAHHTRVGPRLVTTTVETVRFSPPDLVAFRLVRGPVPEVTETFRLSTTGAGTRLDYSGELAADLWAFGRWAGRYAAAKWESTVRASLQDIKVEAERRAARPRAPQRGADST
jgi:Polyketide cyclase / dehydrase and lipid transport